VTTHSAEKGYEKVLAYAGAVYSRDAVDARIIHDITTGTATITDGGNGSVNGLIDTQAAAGGWPDLASTEPPVDSDGDGMPDLWEDQHGLNAYLPDDARLKTVDGVYPNLEVYLNRLVQEITVKQLEDAIVSGLPIAGKPELKPELTFNSHSGSLIIRHKKLIKMVQFYSMSGVRVKTEMVGDYNIETTIEDRGLFVVRIIDEDHRVYSEKIVRW
jgi:hypothetical protein